MADKPTCETCKWWSERVFYNDERGLGRCNRMPPMRVENVRRGGIEIGLGAHPITTRNDYCGEHKEATDANR